MKTAADAADFPPGDALAPPMTNGEVVFEAPWQGRLFGIARVLAGTHVFEWDDFRACLIDELAGRPASEPFAYYDHFQHALERVLADRNIIAAEVLTTRVDELVARPPGHDHDHHDHHDRDHHDH